MFQKFFDKRDLEPKVTQELLNDEFNDSLSMLDMDVDVLMKEEKTNIHVNTMLTLEATSSHNDAYTKLINDQMYNINGEYSKSPNSRREANEKTPVNKLMRPQDISSSVRRPFKKNLRKKLNFGYERPLNLQLGSIYEYMFGTTPQQHSAEADCLTMIRCVTNIAGFFIEWSNNNAIPLVYLKKKV